jgi:hypothetical protein
MGTYGAQGAALGARTIKLGKTRWYVGYKKHTLRLWLHEHHDSVQLAPLISWVTRANVYGGTMLRPSLRHCQWIWECCPSIVVGDGAYLSREASGSGECCLWWNVAILTRLRSDMGVVATYVTEYGTECPQGELIGWLDPKTRGTDTAPGRRASCARVAGKPAVARGRSRLGPRMTRAFWVCFPWKQLSEDVVGAGQNLGGTGAVLG